MDAIKKISLKHESGKILEKEIVFTFDESKHTLESALKQNEAFEKELAERQEAFNKHQKEFQDWQIEVDKGILNKQLYEETKHSHLRTK